MADDGVNPAARLAQALQWDRGRWIWLLLIMVFLHAVLAFGDAVELALRFDRYGIAAGGWWRLLSAHVVHLDLHHLVLNELGLVLMWSLFAADYDALGWIIIVLSAALAISSGLWWLSPSVGWYVGASGVLHAVMAAGTAQHLAARAWDRWILFGCLSAKLAYEQISQLLGHATPFIVVDAHLYGALSGFVMGAVLCWRTAIIRPHTP
jgi:rhomboid family GlyGly-CTERM serine protease